MATFLHRLRRAVKTRFFDSTDFNGQESGVYTGPALADWKVGDQITIGAEPHSRRECLDGEIVIKVLAVNGQSFKVLIDDNMGRIGGYPEFETPFSVEGDLSGDWLINAISGEFIDLPGGAR